VYKTAICIASGPSLTADDVARTRHIPATVYAVNDCHRLAPWAHALYAADFTWWHHHQGVSSFPGRKITVDEHAARQWGLEHVPSDDSIFWGGPKFPIALGLNSGFQALGIAAAEGHTRIILLGYDMGPGENGVRHWFGEHHPKICRGSAYQKWVKQFEAVAPLIAADGIEVINCSRRTALSCFRRAAIEDIA